MLEEYGGHYINRLAAQRTLCLSLRLRRRQLCLDLTHFNELKCSIDEMLPFKGSICETLPLTSTLISRGGRSIHYRHVVESATAF